MLRPWDQSSVLAAYDGGGVRLRVCAGYETLNVHTFCRAASLARLNASLGLAYIVLGCYVGGILSWFPIAPRDMQMTRRGHPIIGQLSASTFGKNHKSCRVRIYFDPAQEGQNPSKSTPVRF